MLEVDRLSAFDYENKHGRAEGNICLNLCFLASWACTGMRRLAGNM